MKGPFRIDDILDSPLKLAVLRVFASHKKGFKATGRKIAKLTGYSAPSTHESLKELNACDVLFLEIIGKQHIYSLNENNRIVQKIIRPIFKAESEYKEEIRNFLLDEIKKTGIKESITSLMLYGSIQTETSKHGSDVDIAVIVSRKEDIKKITDVFLTDIAERFRSYFSSQLDPYIKSAPDFRVMLKKNQPPVSTLIKSYSILYGKEPLEI